MQIIQKNVDSLIPYENNPRDNDKAVTYVANSIEEFGFKVPIVIDTDNVIVAGHTRIKAAKLLGLNTVPCIVADDLNEEQIRAFRLADNKVSEYATWDEELLTLELEGFEELDLAEFGFDTNDAEEDNAEIIEDEIPEEVETKCQEGDLWQLGEHRLICGDSTDIDVIEKLRGGAEC